MIVCVARNYPEFKKWRDDLVVYVGDADALSRIDPADVREIVFVGENYRQHPVYFSDAMLEFQMNVALAKRGDDLRVNINNLPKKQPWYIRLSEFLFGVDEGWTGG